MRRASRTGATAYADVAGIPIMARQIPSFGERNLMVDPMTAGYGRRRARVGSAPATPNDTSGDMMVFRKVVFLGHNDCPRIWIQNMDMERAFALHRTLDGSDILARPRS